MRSAVLALAAILGSLTAGSASGEEARDDLPVMLKSVVAQLQQARVEAKLPLFALDPVLDRVAGERARAVAALPFDERMSPTGSIQSLVQRAGIRRYRTVAEHIEVQSGYPDPARATMQRWRKYGEDWSHVMDPTEVRLGVAATRSTDGMIAFVAVLLAEAPPPPDPAALEADAEDAINRARVEHGLAKLIRSPELAAVARAHSEDMAKHHYFDHQAPEGGGPSDRVKSAKIRYERMAENIAVNLGADDPVDVAVQGWLASKHHRENILNGAFLLTGVGIAESEDGELYFTQLFLTPPSVREPR